MVRINLGVIGLGRMGRIFATHIAQQFDTAKLVGVYNRTVGQAESFAQRVAGVTVYEDYHDMLANPNIQGVIIATHTHTHYDIVIAAAQAGKAIFCEKPMALTLAETDEMITEIEQATIPFQIAFMRRFDKGYAVAKKRIETGEIGQPLTASSVSRDPSCPDPAGADPAMSGGMIVDLAVHDIDSIRWLMNDEVSRVYTEGSVLNCPDLTHVNDIDSAMINLRFSRGGLGQVDACRVSGYGYDIRCEIRGETGTLQIGYLQETPILTLSQQGVTHDVVPWFAERFTPAYRAQIDHFIHCLQTDQAPSVGITDARRALEVAIAADQSLKTGLPVTL